MIVWLVCESVENNHVGSVRLCSPCLQFSIGISLLSAIAWSGWWSPSVSATASMVKNFAPSMSETTLRSSAKTYTFGISMILERGAMACWRFREGGRGAMCQRRGTPRPTCLRWDKPPSTPQRRVPQSPSPSHARVAILVIIHHYHSLLLLRTPPFTPLAPNHSTFG